MVVSYVLEVGSGIQYSIPGYFVCRDTDGFTLSSASVPYQASVLVVLLLLLSAVQYYNACRPPSNNFCIVFPSSLISKTLDLVVFRSKEGSESPCDIFT